jgi:hypothetical protein
MAGNLWQWLQECYYESYKGAPAEGSADDCKSRVIRRRFLGRRSTGPPLRRPNAPESRNYNLGFRVGRSGGLIFLGLLDGTVAAFDDITLDELWKINTGSGFCAPPMTFEVNGKQYLAITSGPSTAAKAKLVNTPKLKDQRNATVLYVFALGDQRLWLRSRLVARFSQIEGYRWLSLIRASGVVKCQLALACRALRSCGDFLDQGLFVGNAAVEALGR